LGVKRDPGAARRFRVVVTSKTAALSNNFRRDLANPLEVVEFLKKAMPEFSGMPVEVM
jgi:hypothetical protein